MNSQDNIDQILVELNVALNSAEKAGDDEDLVIIDRRRFDILLDRLTGKINELTEYYDAIDSARIQDEISHKKKTSAIIDEANASAEDIYAASILYTADALGEISDLIDSTNKAVNELFTQFKKDLRAQKTQVKKDGNELKSHLKDLKDSKKYLNMMKDIDRQKKLEKEAAARPDTQEAEKPASADASAAAPYSPDISHMPTANPQIKINEAYFEKSGMTMPGDEAIFTAEPVYEKADVMVNKDSPYFKWKNEQARMEQKAEFDEQSTEPDEIIYDQSPDTDAEEKDGSDAMSILKNIFFGN